MSTPLDALCPTCGAIAGQPCRRVGGADRISFHRSRWQALQASMGGSSVASKPPTHKKAVARRFGAFLRLYGPKEARTHAVMVLGHGPEPDTPRGFVDELEGEYKVEGLAHMEGIGTEYRMHLNGRPRLKLPSYGASTRRVLNTIWKPGVSRPPWLCAGLKVFKNFQQAKTVATKLARVPDKCEYCGGWHVVGVSGRGLST